MENSSTLKTKSKLGRGMASLIPSGPSADILREKMGQWAPAETPKEELKIAEPIFTNHLEIEIAEIIENDFQPRKIFKEKEMEELCNSIKENGIIQPLIVMKLDDGYRLIAGERRFRAAKKAGLTKVPVVVKNATDRDRLVIALVENIQRSDLNCVEEALAYYQLMEEFKITQEDVSKKVGKDRSTVANFLRILKLPRQVIDLLQRDFLSFGHAKILASIREEEKIIRFSQEVIEKQLSVRELELLIKKPMKPAVEGNPFFNQKLDDLKNQLEGKTGLHFGVKSNAKGAGSISIKFNNEAEFNDIFAFLMRGRS